CTLSRGPTVRCARSPLAAHRPPAGCRLLTREERKPAGVPHPGRRTAGRRAACSAREVVGISRVLRVVYVYFTVQIGVYAVSFWSPALVARVGGLCDTPT